MDAASIATLTADDIVRALQLGVADTELRKVEFAIKNRQRAKARVFRPGQKFKLRDTVRPLYLIGVTGTIVKVNQKRCVVDFDEGQYLGNYPQYGTMVPFDMIEPA